MVQIGKNSHILQVESFKELTFNFQNRAYFKTFPNKFRSAVLVNL